MELDERQGNMCPFGFFGLSGLWTFSFAVSPLQYCCIWPQQEAVFGEKALKNPPECHQPSTKWQTGAVSRKLVDTTCWHESICQHMNRNSMNISVLCEACYRCTQVVISGFTISKEDFRQITSSHTDK